MWVCNQQCCPDFLIFMVIFCFLKNWHPERKKKGEGWKSHAQSNSWSKFSELDMVIFLAHTLSVILLMEEVSRCWHQQTLTKAASPQKKQQQQTTRSKQDQMRQCFSLKCSEFGFIYASWHRDCYPFCKVCWCSINSLYRWGWNVEVPTTMESLYIFFMDAWKNYGFMVKSKIPVTFPLKYYNCLCWQLWTTEHNTVHYALQKRHTPWGESVLLGKCQ